jgi:hypothetical protein
MAASMARKLEGNVLPVAFSNRFFALLLTKNGDPASGDDGGDW